MGAPDPQWGESIKAIVMLREGATASNGDLIAFCHSKLGGFERLRNTAGKALKCVLREP